MEKAILYARAAFDNGEWTKMTFHQRGEIINKFADLMNESKDYLADLETINTGKPKSASLFDI